MKKYNGTAWIDTTLRQYKTSTDTLTTLPAVIYPTDTTATVGLKGNTIQDGTPTPEAPIQPSGCGERTENLFDYTDLEGGYIDLTTGENAPSDGQKRTRNYITVQPNTVYTFSNYDDKCRIHQYSNNSYLGSALSDSSQYTFTTNSNCTRIRISGSKDNFLETTMLNTGSTALPYEPYGYKIPISSANTTTPVYLGEVETTRKIKKLVLTGEETNWNVDSTNLWHLRINNVPATPIESSPSLCCTHYEGVASKNTYSGLTDGKACIRSTGNYIWIRDSQFANLNEFKTWLAQQYAAGTPVTVWYVLATPETAVVNEPLHKIGDYADEVANVSIPVTAGGDTLSVDTTVQPSEVTVNYKGWHPANVKEWDGSQWN